ncbi:hypothetical protein VTL71DRAFT_13738 [Oculimacula yallundae]|uniref:Decarboxylase DEC1 n=1 Tax=Oculimacula yallundae TaxID=86028 RepID=A0ABR4CMJ7_9HELO
MVLPTTQFIPASVYNGLPFINDVKDHPDEYKNDLKELKDLLAKFKMPDTICIKLIHIHFELLDGEVMAFRNVSVPPHGDIETLGPHQLVPDIKLYGCHHFVNESGELQAFEYMPTEGPDMTLHAAFVSEFCAMVTAKGLQKTFGLSLRPDEQEQSGWTELEFPQKRMTFNVPSEIDLPDVPWGYVVTTKWAGIVDIPTNHGHHTHHAHMRRIRGEGTPDDDDQYLGATRLEIGTPFQQIYSSVIKAY